jgi:hypothetical protein
MFFLSHTSNPKLSAKNRTWLSMFSVNMGMYLIFIKIHCNNWYRRRKSSIGKDEGDHPAAVGSVNAKRITKDKAPKRGEVYPQLGEFYKKKI